MYAVRKPIKACQGKGRGALPLREWPCGPFSSTGLRWSLWICLVSSITPPTLLARVCIIIRSHGNQAFHNKHPAGFLSQCVSNRQAAVSHQIHIGVMWEIIFMKMKNGFEFIDFFTSVWDKEAPSSNAVVSYIRSRTSRIQMLLTRPGMGLPQASL